LHAFRQLSIEVHISISKGISALTYQRDSNTLRLKDANAALLAEKEERGAKINLLTMQLESSQKDLKVGAQ
jgi:uncharacterized protein YjiK